MKNKKGMEWTMTTIIHLSLFIIFVLVAIYVMISINGRFGF